LEIDMSATTAVAPAVSATHPLQNVAFRRLWVGSTISIFGDQFYLVALPWLVLQITGSGMALGTILMLGAVPRAGFMLLGGVITDRFSARRILIATATGRMLLVAATAVLVYFHFLQLWHLYCLALAFGIADAFAMPAGQALIPSVVSQEHLPAANALISGSAQACSIAGPAPAGLVLRAFNVATAFAIDAVSFLFVIVALLWLKDSPSGMGRPRGGLWGLIMEGLRYVMKDRSMRSLMLLVTVLNLGVAGPLTVGLAVLAKGRFGSAATYGTLLSALAAGTLLGSLLPALIKQRRHRGLVVLGFSAIVGLDMIAIGLLHQLIPLLVLLATLGVGNGLTAVYVQSWFQGHIDRAFLGRVMSVFMFAAFGLLPFSYAIAGVLVQLKLTLMFMGAGGLVLAATLVAAVNKQVRAID
jgi:hypothetical protein